MDHTHCFNFLSDAADFCELFKNASNLGDGVVSIKCKNVEEMETWQGWEEWGPFPGDHSDLR